MQRHQTLRNIHLFPPNDPRVGYTFPGVNMAIAPSLTSGSTFLMLAIAICTDVGDPTTTTTDPQTDFWPFPKIQTLKRLKII